MSFRFITGFLCAPVLSIGAATVGDYVKPQILAFFVGMWAIGAVVAPALGPILGAAMVDAVDWRWIFWFYTFLSAFILVLLFFLLPESLPSNILVRRARRLRKQTGDSRYYTLEEKETKERPFGPFLMEIVKRPFLMIIQEPGIFALDFYISLAYGAFFLFFEAFPIVFAGVYNFTIMQQSLAFLGFLVGSVFAYLTLITFMIKVVRPSIAAKKMSPEVFLKLSAWVCFFLPFSEFLFGWTAQEHWILPIVWEAFYTIGIYNIFQSSFAYLALNYPRYRASVFAGNAFMRCTFACVFPLFGAAMYNNLATPRFPIAWGSTILAFFTLLMCVIPFLLMRYGAQLRGRSKYAN
jgi:MFS transporter, DHA1 family, multidrug resistance protein